MFRPAAIARRANSGDAVARAVVGTVPGWFDDEIAREYAGARVGDDKRLADLSVLLKQIKVGGRVQSARADLIAGRAVPELFMTVDQGEFRADDVLKTLRSGKFSRVPRVFVANSTSPVVDSNLARHATLVVHSDTGFTPSPLVAARVYLTGRAVNANLARAAHGLVADAAGKGLLRQEIVILHDLTYGYRDRDSRRRVDHPSNEDFVDQWLAIFATGVTDPYARSRRPIRRFATSQFVVLPNGFEFKVESAERRMTVRLINASSTYVAPLRPPGS